MAAPGEYVPDVTEGVTRPEDLPAPQVLPRSRNFPRRSCPRCGHSAYRRRTATRRLHDLGDPLLGRPRVLAITYSQHRCPPWGNHFNAPPG